ncbi:MAG: YIP1 family protein [Gemmatimonadota bacterium]|nr:YIP1 family protein [Gemmatimonadota bacterium]
METNRAPQSEARNPWWLAVRVIDEPVEVFKQLAQRPRALIPLLLILVLFGIVGFGTPDSILRERAQEQVRVLDQRAPDRLTEERRLEILEGAGSVRNRALIAGGGTVVSLFSLALVAVVLLLVFNAYGSAPLKFKDEFAIAAHAYVPQLIGLVLIFVLQRFAGFTDLQLSLGFLFDEGFLHHLGVQFTPFGAWNACLLALGNQIRIGAKSLRGPLLIVGALWVVANLALAGLSAAAGGLAG